MENEIFLSVQKILNGRLDTGIDRYETDLSDTVDALFVESKFKNDVKQLYSAVLTSRQSLSELGYICFKDKDFRVAVEKFLTAVKDLFQYLFSITNQSTDATCLEIIQQIVEHDVERAENGSPESEYAHKINIKIGNPIVLESLVITYNQTWDFDRLGFIDSFVKRYKSQGNAPYDLTAANILYYEVLGNKVERLFRDIVILYNNANCKGDRQETYRKEYYRIVSYDENSNQFTAIRENDMSSIEQFNATRLYDKIIEGQNIADSKRIVLIGSTKEGTLPILQSMLETWQKKNGVTASINVDHITDKNKIRDITTNSNEIRKLLSSYDKIFILDCPEIYSDILMERMDDNYSLMFNTPDESTDALGYNEKTRTRDFDNNNKFAKIYYRVQNYLVDKYTLSGRKIRIVNKRMLDFIGKMFGIDKNGEIINPDLASKEIYIYYSDNLCFRQTIYDMLDYTRLEEHNFKTCRVIKFCHAKGKLSNSREKKIKFSYFKLLETLSCSGTFYRAMTGDCDDGKINDHFKILNAIYIAQNTNIYIDYSGQPRGSAQEQQKQGNWCLPLQITVNLPRFDRYGKEIDRDSHARCRDSVWMTLNDILSNIKDNKEITNVVLFESLYKNFASVLYGSARNYNDMLFLHLYERMYGVGDISFHINWRITNVSILEKPDDIANEEEALSYSYKRTICHIMNVLDADSYRESENVRLTQQAAFNQGKLSEYMDNLKESCVDMHYTDSNLYLRIKKYH